MRRPALTTIAQHRQIYPDADHGPPLATARTAYITPHSSGFRRTGSNLRNYTVVRYVWQLGNGPWCWLYGKLPRGTPLVDLHEKDIGTRLVRS